MPSVSTAIFALEFFKLSISISLKRLNSVCNRILHSKHKITLICCKIVLQAKYSNFRGVLHPISNNKIRLTAFMCF